MSGPPPGTWNGEQAPEPYPYGQQPAPQNPPQQAYPQQQYPQNPPQQPYPQQRYPQNPPQQQYPQQAPWAGFPTPAPPPPKPGSMGIAANDLGQTFSATFGTLRAAAGSILTALGALSALGGAVLGALAVVGWSMFRYVRLAQANQFGVGEVSPDGRDMAVFGLLTAIAVLVLNVAVTAVVMGSARAAGAAISSDRVPAGLVLRSAVRALPRVLVLTCLVLAFLAIAGGAVTLVVAVSPTSGTKIGFGILTGVFFYLVLLAVDILIALRLPLTVPAMMLEPRGDANSPDAATAPTRPLGLLVAAGRSWVLTRGRIWRTVGIGLLIGLIGAVPVGIILQILNVFSSLAFTDHRRPVTTLVTLMAFYWVALVLGTAAGIINAVGSTVLYTDARIRDEGIGQAILDHVENGTPPNPWVRWHERD